jgi:dihydroneopterin aldolase
LDEQLGLEDTRYSPGLEKMMVWLSGTEKSFAHAEEVMRRIGHLQVSDSSIWRRKERWGKRIQEVEEAQRIQANTLGSAEAYQARMRGSQKRLGVSMDGTMVHIHKEGWKELKVGCCFEIEVYPTRVKETGDWEMLAHAAHNRYTAHLGDGETLGQKTWALAKALGWEEACDRQVIGDGSSWIWTEVQERFFDAQQALDWYHATEHLADVATWLYGEQTPRARRWYKLAKTILYQGRAETLAQAVTQAASSRPETIAAALHKEAAYLQTHKRRMQYQELREGQYVIGSGMVESGCKQFKARFCGPGMRWKRSGIEHLIPIRAAAMSGTFDSVWHAACNSPPN